MTVISTVVTRLGIVHATDSLITTVTSGGVNTPVTWKGKKILKVQSMKGAMSFWGLARIDAKNWSTVNWLERQIHGSGSFSDSETFAVQIANELNNEYKRLGITSEPRCGLGIHFTVFENIIGHFVPELFLISNFADPSYSSVRTSGFGVTRETSATAFNMRENIGQTDSILRLMFHKWLDQGNYLMFNNGDPILYNHSAKAMNDMIKTLLNRNALRPLNKLSEYVNIASFPVDTVAYMQKKLCRKGTQIVGGKTRHLSVDPNGVYA
jgi:hypothetical protein